MQPKMTSRSIRKENQKNIIHSLLQNREMLRSDLAAENGISVMTVKNVVDELVCEQVVEETLVSTAVGRKPHTLHLSARFGTVACISMTSREYAIYLIYDIYGTPLERRHVLFDMQLSYQDNLEILCDQLRNDLNRQSVECIGIGVTVPSAYYGEEDLVNYDLIPELKELHLAAYFREKLNVQNISIVHDVFSAAQAEYDKDGVHSLLYFFAGYGVGSAFIQDGRWHTGADQMAGEVGQCLLNVSGEETRLEDLVSLPMLMKQIQTVHPGITPYEAFLLYDKGDPAVTDVIDRAVNLIAVAIYNIIWVLNPEKIVIGSNFNKYAACIVEACNRLIQRRIDNTLEARMVVDIARVQDGELRGCFNIVIERWVTLLICSRQDSSEDL